MQNTAIAEDIGFLETLAYIPQVELMRVFFLNPLLTFAASAWISTGSWDDDPFSLSSIVDSSEAREEQMIRYICSFQIYLNSCVHMLQHALLINVDNISVSQHEKT